jgi:hypothetical protein
LLDKVKNSFIVFTSNPGVVPELLIPEVFLQISKQ